jgi:hypothetical protein
MNASRSKKRRKSPESSGVRARISTAPSTGFVVPVPPSHLSACRDQLPDAVVGDSKVSVRFVRVGAVGGEERGVVGAVYPVAANAVDDRLAWG